MTAREDTYRSVYVVMIGTGMVCEVGEETGEWLVKRGDARYAKPSETTGHRAVVGPVIAR